MRHGRVTGLLDLPPESENAHSPHTPDREHGRSDHLWAQIPPGRPCGSFHDHPSQWPTRNRTEFAVYDFATRKSTIVVPSGTDAHYVPTGHLVYAAGDRCGHSLRPRTLKTVGESKVVVPSVLTKGLGAQTLTFRITARSSMRRVVSRIPPSGILVWVGGMELLNRWERRCAVSVPASPPGREACVLDIRDQEQRPVDLGLFAPAL